MVRRTMLGIFIIMAGLTWLTGPAGAQTLNFSCYLTNAEVNSSPAINNRYHMAYVGAGNKLYAIDYYLGQVIWSYTAGGTVDSSPAITNNGIIYVGARDGKLHALIDTGPTYSKIWEFSCLGNAPISSSPAIGRDGTIYFTDSFGVLYAVSSGGSQKWVFPGAGDSSPAIGKDGTIYAGPHAIKPNGELKWTFAAAAWGVKGPIIGSDGTIYLAAAGTSGQVFAVNPDGTQKWQKWVGAEGKSIAASPALSPLGLRLYIGSLDGYLYALSALDGTQVWAYNAQGAVYSSPAVDLEGTIFVGSDKPALHAVNPDGTQKWVFPTTGSRFRSSPTIFGSEIFVTAYSKFYAVWGSKGLAASEWPMFRQNIKHTGCIKQPFSPAVYTLLLLNLLNN